MAPASASCGDEYHSTDATNSSAVIWSPLFQKRSSYILNAYVLLPTSSVVILRFSTTVSLSTISPSGVTAYVLIYPLVSTLIDKSYALVPNPLIKSPLIAPVPTISVSSGTSEVIVGVTVDTELVCDDCDIFVGLSLVAEQPTAPENKNVKINAEVNSFFIVYHPSVII